MAVNREKLTVLYLRRTDRRSTELDIEVFRT